MIAAEREVQRHGPSSECPASDRRAVVAWSSVIVVVLIGRSVVPEGPLRDGVLRGILLLMAAGEAAAGVLQVFGARQAATMAGRTYSASYHGLVQDFGFYNLAMATLFVLGAVDPARNRVVLPVAMLLYAVHGGTHLLRAFGIYYGGETTIPTRPSAYEMRDGLPLVAAVVGLLLFG